jgi:hypothetical protein
VDDARDVLAKLAANDFASLQWDVTWLTGMVLCAEACAELDDAADGAVLADILAPYANQFVTAGPVTFLGSVAQYLARLAVTARNLDEADTHFAAAAAAHTRVGAPAWLVRTQVDWSSMLLTRQRDGDAHKAVELLDQALATARELALDTLERRAHALREKAARLIE